MDAETLKKGEPAPREDEEKGKKKKKKAGRARR